MKLQFRVFWVIFTVGLAYLLCVLVINDYQPGNNFLRIGNHQANNASGRSKLWFDSNESYNLMIEQFKKSMNAVVADIGANGVLNFQQNMSDGQNIKYLDNKEWIVPANDNSQLRKPKAYIPPTNPVRHIGFVKVHMAGSSPLQNIFFRYGHEKKFTFVVPKTGHYFTKSTKNYEPVYPPRRGGHYDIVCYHACFNLTLFSSLMPRDTTYIAIVRNPYDQFIQSFYYYLRFFAFGYLLKIPNPRIENIISYPDKYDESCLSYTMNAMARDFGFQYNHCHDHTMESAKQYLDSIGDVFKIVLVYERFEESLILMKNLLKWPLKNILFLPEKVNTPDEPINSALLEKFKLRNKLDYLVYNYFVRKIEEKIRKAGIELIEETINFKMILKTVSNWCMDVYFQKLTIPATKWNEEFDITSSDCEMLEKSEFAFIELLRSLQ